MNNPLYHLANFVTDCDLDGLKAALDDTDKRNVSLINKLLGLANKQDKLNDCEEIVNYLKSIHARLSKYNKKSKYTRRIKSRKSSRKYRR